RPLLVAYPERRAAFGAEMPVGRARRAVDRRVPDAQRAPARHLKRSRYPHDVDRVTATARALAADGAIAALIRVGGVAVDREAHGAAAARPFEAHRHRFILARGISAKRCGCVPAAIGSR